MNRRCGFPAARRRQESRHSTKGCFAWIARIEEKNGGAATPTLLENVLRFIQNPKSKIQHSTFNIQHSTFNIFIPVLDRL